MKQESPNVNLPIIRDAEIAIIQSKWHKELSDQMVKKCLENLAQAQSATPQVHVLPGSLELPLAARYLSERNPELEAIIAFGIIVKGDTDHYEMVRDECMRGLSQVSLEIDVPIIVEVLPVHDIADAKARCADDKFNKGIEAAQAAAEIIHWRRSNS